MFEVAVSKSAPAIMKKTIIIFVLTANCMAVTPELFKAIRQVESGNNANAVGDGGKSRGVYQIQRAYWQDACEYGGVKWDYAKNVKSRAKCEQVMRWYWQRYCKDAYRKSDYETLARVHNGGPAGKRIAATKKYWLKVKKYL